MILLSNDSLLADFRMTVRGYDAAAVLLRATIFRFRSLPLCRLLLWQVLPELGRLFASGKCTCWVPPSLLFLYLAIYYRSYLYRDKAVFSPSACLASGACIGADFVMTAPTAIVLYTRAS